MSAWTQHCRLREDLQAAGTMLPHPCSSNVGPHSFVVLSSCFSGAAQADCSLVDNVQADIQLFGQVAVVSKSDAGTPTHLL